MMGYISAVPDQVNVSLIQQEGNWGLVHETGHNHQWNSWTISATTETGCNMWSLYVHQNVSVLLFDWIQNENVQNFFEYLFNNFCLILQSCN
jgi:hypothetical protein